MENVQKQPTRDTEVSCKGAVLELLASRFQVAMALKKRYILEASAHSYIREGQILRAMSSSERPSDFDQTLENLGHELAFCNNKLDQYYEHVMRVVGDLHHSAIRVAVLYPGDESIHTLCETFLRLPLPVSPAPGEDINTLDKVQVWLNATTAHAEEDIAMRFLGSVDSLSGLLGSKITTHASLLN